MSLTTNTVPHQAIRIPYGDDENQFGDLRLPEGEGPFPVAIVIHGGFWRAKFNLDHINPLADALTAQGVATWTIEYRRVGHEGGAWPGTFIDSALATNYVRTLADTYPIDLNRVVTIGHSAGGHLAVWLAGRNNLPTDSVLRTSDLSLTLKGVVSLAGVSDLALMHDVHQIRETINGFHDNPTYDLLNGTPIERPDRYNEGSPIKLLPCGVRLCVIHGSLDINVPIGISDHFVQAARSAGDAVDYMILPTAEHFQLIDPDTEAGLQVVQSTIRLLQE
ncbi:alpha/beta fold hydrolase [Paenibacillus sp. N1-5-1-14]|uniref:alpha/beta hydrolase family protein n=1 Tax=Paenibacillus radicibacter TaxID=2972488 RepID=UPI002158E9F0|nr:alpha/beta fold hydrolase [Paenibacillus radicibacter]MCR8644499.1 alpha/beta fold hydrolase [Paenibacillus radicibacter]